MVIRAAVPGTYNFTLPREPQVSFLQIIGGGAGGRATKGKMGGYAVKLG